MPLDFVKRSISVKVALLVNTMLLVVMAAGSLYLIRQQSRSLEEQLLSRGKMMSIIGAKGMARIMEEAIDNDVLSLNDFFDTEYAFVPGFDPPKYHTKYDTYLDRAIIAFQDEFLKDSSFQYAFSVDRKGYVPTHNARYQKPMTTIKKIDLGSNRTKRVFNDAASIKAAENEEEGYLQIYHMDTGDIIWDIASPIYVKGRHWGNFRIGISLATMNQAKRDLANSLMAMMGAILLVSVISVFIAVRQALKPLGTLTAMASDMADGDVEQKIAVKTNDEIGALADVLERMRVSLVTAMRRLSPKSFPVRQKTPSGINEEKDLR